MFWKVKVQHKTEAPLTALRPPKQEEKTNLNKPQGCPKKQLL